MRDEDRKYSLMPCSASPKIPDQLGSLLDTGVVSNSYLIEDRNLIAVLR